MQTKYVVGPVFTNGQECNLGDGGKDDEGGNPGGEGDKPGETPGGGEKPTEGDNNQEPTPPRPFYPTTNWASDFSHLAKSLGDEISYNSALLRKQIRETQDVEQSIDEMALVVNSDLDRIAQSVKLLADDSSGFYNRVSSEMLTSIDLKMNDLLSKLSRPTVPDTKPEPNPDSSGGTDFWSDKRSMDLLQNTYSISSYVESIKRNTSSLDGMLLQMNGHLARIAEKPSNPPPVNPPPVNPNPSQPSASAWNNFNVTELMMRQNMVNEDLKAQTQAQRQLLSELRGIHNTLKSGAGTGTGTDNGAGNGSKGEGVDYSKMPGSADNPLHVLDGKYASNCHGNNCFFDVPAIEKQLMDANDKLKQKQDDIAKDVKSIFDFSLSGGARVMECFDLFSYNGRDYRVCPPSGEYWQTLAALMMFIFYFVALMVIFRR